MIGKFGSMGFVADWGDERGFLSVFSLSGSCALTKGGFNREAKHAFRDISAEEEVYGS